MRLLIVLPLLILPAVSLAKPPKTAPPEPVVAPVEAAPVERTPPPEPEPEPEPEPTVVSNTSFQISVTMANGATRTGHVTGLERSVDFNGYKGFTSDSRKLTLTLEAAGTEREVAWTDLASVTITPGKAPDEVDCTYDSTQTPTMYECTLRTTANAVLRDGSKGQITSRHRWRLTFENGETAEVQVYKHTQRMPEDEAGSGDADGPFAMLQARIAASMKADLIRSITVKVP